MTDTIIIKTDHPIAEWTDERKQLIEDYFANRVADAVAKLPEDLQPFANEHMWQMYADRSPSGSIWRPGGRHVRPKLVIHHKVGGPEYSDTKLHILAKGTLNETRLYEAIEGYCRKEKRLSENRDARETNRIAHGEAGHPGGSRVSTTNTPDRYRIRDFDTSTGMQLDVAVPLAGIEPALAAFDAAVAKIREIKKG